MNVVRTGIILNTENYAECVSFYRTLFGLKVLFEQPDLTCFEYGGSYLMIETEGCAVPGAKTMRQNSTKLRFNVASLEDALEAIHAYGLDAATTRHAWGSTIDIHDPDGNRVGIRDDLTFKDQLSAG